MNSKYNLRELFAKYRHISIPMLQRDYAQGRNNQGSVRSRFLSSLYDFLHSSSESEKSLDFIYGYNEEGVFLPIDGQQRITTLWLLHVFLKNKANQNDNYKWLNNFTYATRDCTKEFCEALCDYNFSDKTPSSTLRQVPDIKPLIAKQDPSILSMLTMLDAIHDKFKDSNAAELIKRLDKIIFHLVDMGQYGLGEELYIKMNARGKLLSPFENFKSWIQCYDNIDQELGLFADIDNIWINYFWKKDQKSFDKDIIDFMCYLAMFFFLNQSQQPKNNSDKELFIDQHIAYIDSQRGDFDEKLFLYDDGTPIFSKENLHKANAIISFFILIEDNGFTIPRVVGKSFDIPKLFAIFFYALNQTSIDNYKDWQDVSDHIINNTRPNTEAGNIISMFSLLDTLAPNSADIYKGLTEYKSQKSLFASNRVEEEKIKATIIMSQGRHGSWEIAINEAQNNSYFNGWIRFLLDYSKDSEGTYSYDSFIKYASVACKMFGRPFLEQNITSIQRALLSIGDYSIYMTNFFLGNASELLQKGKEPWHNRFFVEKVDIIKEFFESFAAYDLSSDSKTINAFEDIIESNLAQKEWDITKDWWRWLMVSYPELLQYCKDNRFSCDDVEGEHLPVIYLLPKIKRTKGQNLMAAGFRQYLKTNYPQLELSQFNDNLENELCFTINQNIEVHMEDYSNTIIIGDKTFSIAENHKYKIITQFYEDIYKQSIR